MPHCVPVMSLAQLVAGAGQTNVVQQVPPLHTWPAAQLATVQLVVVTPSQWVTKPVHLLPQAAVSQHFAAGMQVPPNVQVQACVPVQSVTLVLHVVPEQPLAQHVV